MLLAARNTFALGEMVPCYFSKCMLCYVEEGILKGSTCLKGLFFKIVSGNTGQTSIDSRDSRA